MEKTTAAPSTPEPTAPNSAELRFDQEGWGQGIGKRPCTFFNERPEGMPISLIVVHGISLPPGCFGTSCVEDLFEGRFKAPSAELEALEELHVSSHFFIRRTGEILQFVPCSKRAWHAGASSFKGVSNCNDFSIGIELEGTDFVPYEEIQYQSLAKLADGLLGHYPIEAIAGHSDIAPGRKTDPGPYFDWKKLQNLVKKSRLIEYPGELPQIKIGGFARQNLKTCT